ncbi:MAG: hypothetical protein M4579_005222 [Chaenotheca gracillima]|nr:MAG: hypothetical protein M4579_005222 [Chaenotheca gracillima]
MTTNHRKELDEAITRPGRIDREFEFTLASRSQAEGIFTWNFGRVNGELQGAGDELDRPVEAISQTNEDVSKLAKRFGDVLLDKELPPAAIQTFLMSYDDPNKALAETPDWLCEVGKKAQAKVDHKNSARSDSARMEESRI